MDFAVTFGAVGALQVLWDFLGGEPMELRIDELEEEVKKVQSSVTSLPSIIDGINEVKDEMREIQSSAGVLSDLRDGNIGIERIWQDRQHWQDDDQNGLRAWKERVCQAKRVDIVSNTLRMNWMKPELLQKLFAHIKLDAKVRVRILIYEPGSLVQRLQAADQEKRPESTKSVFDAALLWLAGDEEGMLNRMASDIKETLHVLATEGKEALPVDAWKNLQVGLTSLSVHSAQIIRADDRMLVATYLAGESGSPSPTMQLRGTESSYFQKYAEQVETLWERAKPVEDKEFAWVVRKYGAHPTQRDIE